MRVEGIEEDTYRGGLGQQAQFIKFQLERGSEVRGAVHMCYSYFFPYSGMIMWPDNVFTIFAFKLVSSGENLPEPPGG